MDFNVKEMEKSVILAIVGALFVAFGFGAGIVYLLIKLF